MDTGISLMKTEDRTKRVLEWLKHCSAAPKDEEHCNGASKDLETVIDGNTSIHLQDNCSEKSVKCSESRQNKDASSTTQKHHSKTKRKKWSETDSGCLSASTVRRQYSSEENQQIIKYIVENDAFPFLKGTLLWQKMEKDKICFRSWQSMKSQFITKIYPNINECVLKDRVKKQFIEYMKPSKQNRFIHMMPGQRGWRKNGNYYSIEEDIIILKYILRRRRHLSVHGNSIWQTMEDRQILPGRTWQSMRSRYLKVIMHSLEVYESKEPGIVILKSSKEKDLSSKKKLYSDMPLPAPLSPCTNTRKVNMKAANQDIRKYAISTGAQLASKLKLTRGKATENVVETDKEMQYTGRSDVRHEAPDIEIPLDEHAPSECCSNETIEKSVECLNTCAGSNIAVDSQNHDVASADVSTKESDTATQILFENTSNENSQTERNNLEESVLLSSVTENKNAGETEMFIKNNSPLGSSGREGRSDIECAMPSVISDVQESLDSVSQNGDGVKTMVSIENHTIEVSSVSDGETHNEPVDCEGSFCSQETVKHNTSYCLDHFVNKHCERCSVDHKLSPCSN